MRLLASLILLSSFSLGLSAMDFQKQIICGAEVAGDRWGDNVFQEAGFPISLDEWSKRVAEDPLQKQMAELHQEYVYAIAGAVDRRSPENAESRLEGESKDDPSGFQITEEFAVGLKSYTTPEGKRNYDQILQSLCQRMSQQSGFDVTNRCFETSKQKFEMIDQFLSKHRPEAVAFADQYSEKLEFPEASIWREFHTDDFNACPLTGTGNAQEHRFDRDDVLNTAICYGMPTLLGATDIVVSGFLYNSENQIVGRSVRMSNGGKVETYYAPFVPGRGLLNVVFFNVFGGSAESWNQMIEQRLGPLSLSRL